MFNKVLIYRKGTRMFLFYISLLFFSCNNIKTIQIVDFSLDKKIVLPIPDEVRNSSLYLNTYPYKIKFIENEQQLLAVFYGFNTLYFYDLNSLKIINKVQLNNTFNFDNVEYINKDSIFIFCSGVDKYFYDTSIVVINDKGIIKHSFGINQKGVISSKTYNLNNLNDSIYMNALFPLFTSNNVLFQNRAYFIYNISHENFIRSKGLLPIIGYYNFDKKAAFKKNISYPVSNSLLVFNYPENILKVNFSFEPQNKEMFVSFSFSPYVYKMDVEKNETRLILMPSKLIDTSSVYLENTNPQNNLFIYGRVNYISELNKYIRINSRKINDSIYKSISTYDKNFNYLGEKLISYKMNIENDHYFYAGIINDKLVVEQYKSCEIDYASQKLDNDLKLLPKTDTKNETCNANQNKEKSQKEFIQYLSQKNIKPSTALILVLHDMGCGSCNEYLLKTLSINSFLLKLKTNPLHLIYLTDKIDLAKSYMKKLNIEPYIIDSPHNYNPYHPFKYFNPRLVLIKDKKIISDTIYMPDQLELLLERLMNFYGAKPE